MEKEITLAEAPGIPPGFCIVSDVIEDKRVFYLRRIVDDRRIKIKWKPGTQRYTSKELGRYFYKDGDEENPLLKGLM